MRIRTVRDIGILIREARLQRGLTQVDFAKMINVTQTWVSWIENGKPTAEIGSVLLALQALGIEMDFNIPSRDADAGDPRKTDHDDEVPPYTL